MALPPDFADAVRAFQQGQLDVARDVANQLVAANGPRHETDHLLGLIHCRVGDFGPGVELLRRASTAEPANPSYRLMLARALIDAGRPAEAVETARGGPSAGPARIAFLHIQAEAAELLGDAALAEVANRGIAEAQPQEWRAWNNLATALAAQEKWPEAADALERACALSKESSLRERLAAALQRAGRTEDAAAQMRILIQQRPGDIDLRIALGRQLVALTDFAEAERVFRSAIALEPANVSAVQELGFVLERTSRMDALAELADEAAGAGMSEEQLSYLRAAVAFRAGDAAQARRFLALGAPPPDSARWYRLLAKVEDALDEPEKAFAAVVAMNGATAEREAWRQRGAEYRRNLRTLAQVLTPEWAASIPRLAAGPRRTPVFLVGFPRSGTTLLDTFLMGHPDVEVLEEIHMLGAAELVVGKIAELPSCPPEVLERARDAYFGELDRHVDPGLAGMVIDKLPLNILGGQLIHALFPDARIIFSQRHPCDAVLSGVMQTFVLNDAMAAFLDLEDAADLYNAVMGVWQRTSALLPLDVHTLVYEELVASPETPLRQLLDFLDLEWNDRILDHQRTAAARGAVSTASYDQVTQPLSTRPAGRWRRYRDQMEPVLPTLLKWAEYFGYDDR